MKENNENLQKLESNSIVFNAGNTEPILELCENGDILVKGKLIQNDKEVVDAMREFLQSRNADALKLSYDNPTPLDVVTNVHAMVMAHPNDSELGGNLRKYINSLREENKNE